MRTKEYRPTALLIRRFVAITLTILSVLALFWPSAIALGGTFRTEQKVRVQEYREELREEEGEYYRGYQAYIAHNVIQNLLTERIERAEKQDDPETAGALRTVSGAIQELVANKSIEMINRDFFSGLYTAFEDLGLSFEEIREIAAKLPYYADKSRELWPKDLEPFDSEIRMAKLGVIGYNVLFFLVIALGVGAVILMFLNRTEVLTVLHAFFSLLLAGLAIGLWIILLINGEHLLIPGVSAFLTPIFAIAACFVYQRDKRCSGIFPKRAAAPEPAEGPVLQEPAEEPSYVAPLPQGQMKRQAPEPDEWVCPVCNGRNALSDRFCSYCGTGREQEPAPEPETPHCPNCGEPIDPDMKFCVRCGAKLG